jgi:hypothetical protein
MATLAPAWASVWASPIPEPKLRPEWDLLFTDQLPSWSPTPRR